MLRVVMPDESEWRTRKERIDARLESLGWKIVPWSEGLALCALDWIAVEELPTTNGPADYGLFVEGKRLGVDEVFEILMQDCALHTVLLRSHGTFTPYSQGVKASALREMIALIEKEETVKK